jgi:hypothetical protein
MTLLELLVSMSVMLLVVGMLAGLATGVQLSFGRGEAYGTITQHARVVLDRITRTANEAYANDVFPGVLVVPDYDGSVRFPEVLVVWNPKRAVANRTAPSRPGGLPLWNELVIYCPDRYSRALPSHLVEIRPTSTATVPAVTAATAWQTQIETLRKSTQGDLLTPLLRTAALSGGQPRGVVRFERVLTPSDNDLTGWQTAGSTADAWGNLPWLHAVCFKDSSPRSGLRQARVRIELQLVRSTTDNTVPEAAHIIPFFGSAAVYYTKSSEVIP